MGKEEAVEEKLASGSILRTKTRALHLNTEYLPKRQSHFLVHGASGQEPELHPPFLHSER